MSEQAHFPTHAAAVAAGWFSRRYRTGEIHFRAREAKFARYAAKVANARLREAAARAKRAARVAAA